MLARYLYALAGVALLGCATSAWTDARSDQLISQARQKVYGAKTMQADVDSQYYRYGQRGTIKGTVRMMKPNLLRMDVRDSEEGSVLAISNGRVLYLIDAGSKEYQVRPLPQGVDSLVQILGTDLQSATVVGFFTPRILRVGGTTRALGKRTVGERAFEVVQVGVARPGNSRQIFIGPSGIAEGIEVEDRNGYFRAWVRNVRLDAPIPPETFRWTPPADFRRVFEIEEDDLD